MLFWCYMIHLPAKNSLTPKCWSILHQFKTSQHSIMSFWGLQIILSSSTECSVNKGSPSQPPGPCLGQDQMVELDHEEMDIKLSRKLSFISWPFVQIGPLFSHTGVFTVHLSQGILASVQVTRVRWYRSTNWHILHSAMFHSNMCKAPPPFTTRCILSVISDHSPQWPMLTSFMFLH